MLQNKEKAWMLGVKLLLYLGVIEKNVYYSNSS